MRCAHFDRPQRFCVEPAVAMTKAEAAEGTDLAIDDSKFEFAIERRRVDIPPPRAIEKPSQRCRKFLHDRRFRKWPVERIFSDHCRYALIFLNGRQIRISTDSLRSST